MKLWDLQRHFQSWLFRGLEEETAKLSVQNPCLLFKVCFSWWTKTPARQKSASYQQNPKTDFYTNVSRLISLCWTFWSLPQVALFPSIRVALPQSSHRGKVPSHRAWRGCCAVFSSCAATGEAHIDLPLSKSRRREGGCCWTTEDYSFCRGPMSHSIWVFPQHQVAKTHSTMDTGSGHMFKLPPGQTDIKYAAFTLYVAPSW